MSTRILLVDDFEPWCRFVTSTVEKDPDLKIIGVASDGLMALQKATELKPDLILLDIGLPKLNGIEVARQTRQRSLNSKIVFMSIENSPDIVREALNTGANAYVHKARAESDLLPAIDAALQIEEYVSSTSRG